MEIIPLLDYSILEPLQPHQSKQRVSEAPHTPQIRDMSDSLPSQGGEHSNSMAARTRKLTKHETRSSWKGADIGAPRRPPTNGPHPNGKCLTCIVNERQCRSVDGKLVDDSCATCAGLAAAPGKKNMVRKCVWYDPENGIHCFADAKTEKKRRKLHEVAGARDRKSVVVHAAEDIDTTVISGAAKDHGQADNNTDANHAHNDPDAAFEERIAEAESILEIAEYEIVLMSLVLAVGENLIDTNPDWNLELLYQETTKSLAECTTAEEKAPYLEYISRMNLLILQGQGVSHTFMMKWLRHAEALLN